MAKGAAEGIESFVGLDPVEVSIEQAQERWGRYQGNSKRGEGLFRAEFYAQDYFGKTIESIPIIKEVRFCGRGGGFDIVSIMFCMHYAFENEENVRTMLENIASALKRGGKLIGCVPNSDVIGEHVREVTENKEEEEESESHENAEWGNDIYNIRFEGKTPADGIFERPFGDKYYCWYHRVILVLHAVKV
jgi:mRNA (guanine-N7-)-methyltransferase